MKKTFFVASILFTIFSQGADAALLFFDPSQTSAKKGETIRISVYVDPEEEILNSFDISVSFPKELLSFKGFSENESVLRLWISPPKAKNGIVQFAALVPGGIERLYDPMSPQKQAVKLTTLLFETIKEGEGAFSVTGASVLKNDGKGSFASVTHKSAEIFVKKSDSLHTEESPQNKDVTPPEPFSIRVIQGSLFGKTPRLAYFSTTDKDTGISHYEVKTGSGPYIEGESPVPLPYKTFSYDFSVKAVDAEGNEREQSVRIKGNTWPTLLWATFCLFIVLFYVKNKKVQWVKRS